MIRSNRVLVVLLVGMSMALSASLAQPQSSSQLEARAALERFLVAWNSGDNNQVRQQLNFPHVTHSPAGLVIAEEPQDFATDYTTLRSQGWGSSRWDSVATFQVSEDKVNFGVDFSRLTAAGEVYQQGYVFYVFTRQDGHWGMQYRAGIPGRRQDQVAGLEQARIEATAAVVAFFNAFNRKDQEALNRVHHTPQAIILPNSNSFLYATERNLPPIRTNFDGLQQQEDWDHSVFRDLTARSVSPTRVIFELVFERINSNNEVYRRTPALWVLGKREGRWGVEFRSLQPSTLE